MKFSRPYVDPNLIVEDERPSLKFQSKQPTYVVKHPWNHSEEDMSSKERLLHEQQRQSVENFQFKQPWDIPHEDILAHFDQQVEAQDITIRHPWEITPSVTEEQNRQKQLATTYQFQSLWKPLPISIERQQMIENYKVHEQCPFQREDNYILEKNIPAKRMLNKPTTTLAPWTYGNQAPDPINKKIQPPRPTSLWNVPPESKKKYQFESSGDPILDSLREQLMKHGANGILSLSKKFKIIDSDNSGTLDKNEFKKAMKELNIIDLSEKAINHLFHYFDEDDTGSITLDEFLYGIRGSMNARRKSFVAQAFKILDRDNSGVIDYNDIKDMYDASHHPDVIQGHKTVEEVLNEFLQHFEKNPVHVHPSECTQVTYAEFERYYANISASIDNDDYFELMMRNSWHISGGDGWCGNTTNKRVLVTHEDGSQTVEEMQHDLGLRANDVQEMRRRLESQGIGNISKMDSRGEVDDNNNNSNNNDNNYTIPNTGNSYVNRIRSINNKTNDNNGMNNISTIATNAITMKSNKPKSLESHIRRSSKLSYPSNPSFVQSNHQNYYQTNTSAYPISYQNTNTGIGKTAKYVYNSQRDMGNNHVNITPQSSRSDTSRNGNSNINSNGGRKSLLEHLSSTNPYYSNTKSTI